ncbi:hypothetical protein ON010_g17277 [Phytophthora cinnamomi]|nr:hypothetical protein ON010_g17277 [Phytophthora cinnamomi]
MYATLLHTTGLAVGRSHPRLALQEVLVPRNLLAEVVRPLYSERLQTQAPQGIVSIINCDYDTSGAATSYRDADLEQQEQVKEHEERDARAGLNVDDLVQQVDLDDEWNCAHKQRQYLLGQPRSVQSSTHVSNATRVEVGRVGVAQRPVAIGHDTNADERVPPDLVPCHREADDEDGQHHQRQLLARGRELERVRRGGRAARAAQHLAAPARRAGVDATGRHDRVQDPDGRPPGCLLYDLAPSAQPVGLLRHPHQHRHPRGAAGVLQLANAAAGWLPPHLRRRVSAGPLAVLRAARVHVAESRELRALLAADEGPRAVPHQGVPVAHRH